MKARNHHTPTTRGKEQHATWLSASGLLVLNQLMTSDATKAIAVFMTAASAEEANTIANIIVESRLAACVQILPQVESVYRWQGKVERQQEVLLIAKTTAAKFEDLERQVRAVHSYETPEIVAVPLTAGSGRYLDWLNASVNPDVA